MADNISAITAALDGRPAPVVNGYDRLTAAAAPPTTPPPPQTEPPGQAHPAPEADQPSPAPAAQPTPYLDDPHLLPEHALLGSLLHAPKALDALQDFLGVRDFSTPQTRAVYATLRGLHRTGGLIDVAALPTEAEQLRAANENHVRLFTELRATPPRFTSIAVTDVPKLVASLVTGLS